MSITTGKLEPSSICDGSTSIINNQKSKNEAEEHVCFKGGTKMNLNNFARVVVLCMIACHLGGSCGMPTIELYVKR